MVDLVKIRKMCADAAAGMPRPLEGLEADIVMPDTNIDPKMTNSLNEETMASFAAGEHLVAHELSTCKS